MTQSYDPAWDDGQPDEIVLDEDQQAAVQLRILIDEKLGRVTPQWVKDLVK